jgi:hypothetical protein
MVVKTIFETIEAILSSFERICEKVKAIGRSFRKQIPAPLGNTALVIAPAPRTVSVIQRKEFWIGASFVAFILLALVIATQFRLKIVRVA